jgi:hypothetical protein
MVAGKLEARGRSFGNIKFTLNEPPVPVVEEPIETVSVNTRVKLVAGRTFNEGRLQV